MHACSISIVSEGVKGRHQHVTALVAIESETAAYMAYECPDSLTLNVYISSIKSIIATSSSPSLSTTLILFHINLRDLDGYCL